MRLEREINHFKHSTLTKCKEKSITDYFHGFYKLTNWLSSARIRQYLFLYHSKKGSEFDSRKFKMKSVVGIQIP